VKSTTACRNLWWRGNALFTTCNDTLHLSRPPPHFFLSRKKWLRKTWIRIREIRSTRKKDEGRSWCMYDWARRHGAAASCVPSCWLKLLFRCWCCVILTCELIYRGCQERPSVVDGHFLTRTSENRRGYYLQRVEENEQGRLYNFEGPRAHHKKLWAL